MATTEPLHVKERDSLKRGSSVKQRIALLLGTAMVSMTFVAALNAAPAQAKSWHWHGPVSKSVCVSEAAVKRTKGIKAECKWTPYGYYWGTYS